MERERAQAVIEAVLFAMGDSVSISDLALAVDENEKFVKEILEEMKVFYAESNRGIQLVELEDAVQLRTKDDFYEELIKVDGVGHETALFLSLLPDFFVKYTASKNVDSVVLDTSKKLVNYFRTIDRIRNNERFYIFCLNAQKKLVKRVSFNADIISAVSVPLTDFSQKVAFAANRAVIIMHTHPNGNPNPTEADIDSTKRMIKAASAVGVKIDDHIIVTNNEYYSFGDNGIMKNLLDEVKNEEKM